MESTRFQRLNFWWATFQFFFAILCIGNFVYFSFMPSETAKPLDESKCYVRKGINHPINITKDTNMAYVSDAGKQFFVIFISGIVLNLLIAVQSFVSCFSSQKHAGCVRVSNILMQVVYFGFIIACTAVRYSHAGKVCSGDYIY